MIEEYLQVDKQWDEAGVVELRKTIKTRAETVPVDLAHEELHIEHVPVNRALGYGEEARPRQEGDTFIIPIIEEEIVVTKRQVIREEVHIRKKQVVIQQQVSDTVKSEHLDVKTTGNIQQLGK